MYKKVSINKPTLFSKKIKDFRKIAEKEKCYSLWKYLFILVIRLRINVEIQTVVG